jgi:4-coumarate--CoA ligase
MFPLEIVLDAKKVNVLSDNPELDTISGHCTVESLVREGIKLPKRPRKLLGGNRMAYLY